MTNEAPNFDAREGDAGIPSNGSGGTPDGAQTAADDRAAGLSPAPAGGGEVIGRVAAPPQLESTPEHFHFWVERNRLIETNQFVRTESIVEGQTVQFFGVIDEVRRSSRKRDILEEYDVADGAALFEPPFRPEGVTYARASILRTEPGLLTPALEQSLVRLGGREEAAVAYAFNDMRRALPVGLLCNGARGSAGPGFIDLAYLLGERGGHLNVNGMAGVAAKSSFLLTLVKLLLHESARSQPGVGGGDVSRPAADPFYVVPIVLNVKGEDLMWVNRRNREFDAERARNEEGWRALGVPAEPFVGAEFFCPPDPRSEEHAPSVTGCNAQSYFWSPRDVFAAEAFRYLFSDEDTSSPVMMACVYDIVARMTDTQGRLRAEMPQTWNALLEWLRNKPETEADRMHSTGTWRAVYRRLFDILSEGRSIFPPDARGPPARRDTQADFASAGSRHPQPARVSATLRRRHDCQTGGRGSN